MKVFWRETELTEMERELLTALRTAQYQSGFRNSASTVAFKVAYEATEDFTKGVAAALATLGVYHAPITHIYNFIESGDELPLLVPGWGQSFVKGEDDPLYLDVKKLVGELDSVLMDQINGITEELHAIGKNIFPNPGLWTVAAAMVLGADAQTANYLFLSPRIDAWATLIQNI